MKERALIHKVEARFGLKYVQFYQDTRFDDLWREGGSYMGHETLILFQEAWGSGGSAAITSSLEKEERAACRMSFRITIKFSYTSRESHRESQPSYEVSHAAHCVARCRDGDGARFGDWNTGWVAPSWRIKFHTNRSFRQIGPLGRIKSMYRSFLLRSHTGKLAKVLGSRNLRNSMLMKFACQPASHAQDGDTKRSPC